MKKKSTKNIKIAFLLNFFFSIIELVGGIYTNSIAIIADALHDFGDCLSIGVAWFLEKKSEKKPNKVYTFGYGRFSVLGALISTLFLLISSIAVICIAIPRIMNSAEVHYDGVLLLAVFGVAINGLAVYKTSKGKSLNEKAINLHLLEDVFGWIAVLTTSIIMKIFEIPVLDPILSILVAVYILFRVLKNLKKIFEVFLEKAPKDINIDEIRKHLLANKNITDIHHIHLWTLDGINNYISCHVVLTDKVKKGEIKVIRKDIYEELFEHKINHITLEFEYASEKCDDLECDVNTTDNNHFGHSH